MHCVALKDWVKGIGLKIARLQCRTHREMAGRALMAITISPEAERSPKTSS